MSYKGRSLSPNRPTTQSSEGDFEAKLLESKLMRKKAEEDARMLANRVALLQLEEKKALKKIEETRKKAREILELKQRNLEIQRQKDEVDLAWLPFCEPIKSRL